MVIKRVVEPSQDGIIEEIDPAQCHQLLNVNFRAFHQILRILVSHGYPHISPSSNIGACWIIPKGCFTLGKGKTAKTLGLLVAGSFLGFMDGA